MIGSGNPLLLLLFVLLWCRGAMDHVLKQRSIIEFYVKLGETSATKIHRILCEAYGDDAMAHSAIWKWVKRFKQGKQSIRDEPRPGRPKTSATPEKLQKLDDLIKANRRIRVTDLAEQLACSVGSVVNMVRQLGYRKVCARWVPRELTQDQKENRRQICEDLLREYRAAGDQFFNGVITVDETWAHHYCPETRRQSLEWRHPGSPVSRHFKVAAGAGKVMVTVFWDRDGVILVDFLEAGKNVDSNRYINTLRKLKRAVKEKRPELEASSCGIRIHHDNARPHTSRATVREIERLGWSVMRQQPYSPDLAPSDYHLFGPMKDHLRGRRFEGDAAVKSAVKEWIRSCSADFFRAGFLRWVERWEKCVQLNGDYVE